MSETTPRSGRPVTSSRIPGGYGRRRAKGTVVPHGHASPELCETVFRAAISAWGLSGTTDESRDELLWSIAEVLAHGTSSAIDWEVVSFDYEGTTYTMAPFAAVAAKEINYVNPIRVWVRDFRKAEVAVRISELLNSPENIELRQVCAANYGTTIDNSRFCFDTSHALHASGMVLSHADGLLISQLSAMVISRAQEDAVARGFAQAAPNYAGTVGGNKPTPQVAPAASTTPAERGSFKPLR